MWLLFSQIICVSSCLASVIALSPQFPNQSESILHSNQTQRSWPKIPWTKPIGKDLYMNFYKYHDEAPEAQWDDISEDLDALQQRIENTYYWATSESEHYASKYTDLTFGYQVHIQGGNPRLLATEAIQVLKATKDLFFVDGKKPRGFLVFAYDKENVRGAHLNLYIRSSICTWPRHIPFESKLPGDMVLEVKGYGRDAWPPPFSEVQISMQHVIKDFESGKVGELVTTDKYTQGSLDVWVLRPSDKMLHVVDGPKPLYIDKKTMAAILEYIYNSIGPFKNFPREFYARIKDSAGPLADLQVIFNNYQLL